MALRKLKKAMGWFKPKNRKQPEMEIPKEWLAGRKPEEVKRLLKQIEKKGFLTRLGIRANVATKRRERVSREIESANKWVLNAENQAQNAIIELEKTSLDKDSIKIVRSAESALNVAISKNSSLFKKIEKWIKSEEKTGLNFEKDGINTTAAPMRMMQEDFANATNRCRNMLLEIEMGKRRHGL